MSERQRWYRPRSQAGGIVAVAEGAMSDSRNKIGASSIARIAGNILSGMAADHLVDEEDADRALRLARYIARKAEEPGGERNG